MEAMIGCGGGINRIRLEFKAYSVAADHERKNGINRIRLEFKAH